MSFLFNNPQGLKGDLLVAGSINSSGASGGASVVFADKLQNYTSTTPLTLVSSGPAAPLVVTAPGGMNLINPASPLYTGAPVVVGPANNQVATLFDFATAGTGGTVVPAGEYLCVMDVKVGLTDYNDVCGISFRIYWDGVRAHPPQAGLIANPGQLFNITSQLYSDGTISNWQVGAGQNAPLAPVSTLVVGQDIAIGSASTNFVKVWKLA